MPSLSKAVVLRCASCMLLVLVLCAVGRRADAGETSRMPPGAFLRRPVSDLAALNQELRDDSRVMSRYTRLFHLSPERVRATFAHLHLTRLRQDMLLAVHYVHAHETIGAKLRRVRRGTPVFALPDGTPLLVKVCGNPLRAGDPRGHLTLQPGMTGGSLLPNAEEADPRDVPDFDPQEPLLPSDLPNAAHTTALRDALPPMALEPESEDRLAPDEVAADALASEDPPAVSTPVQAKNPLEVWAAGGTLIGIVGAESDHGPEEHTGSILSAPRELVSPLPSPRSSDSPAAPPITPEPGGIATVLALVTTALALRRRRARP